DERYNSALDYYYLKIKNKPTQGFLKAPTHIRMIQNDTVSVNFDNYMNSIIDFSLFKAYIKEKDLSNKDSIIETYVHFLKYDPMLNIDRTAQKQHQLNYDIDVLQLPYDMAVENIDRNCRLQQTSIDFITYKRIKSIEDIYQVTSAYPELYKELEKIDIDFQNRIDWFFNWGLLSIDCQFNDGELISVDVKVLYSSESVYLYLLTHSEKEQNEIIREDNE
ncbi:MAG: hypothetical protein LBQ60_21475, partial [Bacteroidales bacterium]|nr:hypothetical protein [Bacteroidales bacterium]